MINRSRCRHHFLRQYRYSFQLVLLPTPDLVVIYGQSRTFGYETPRHPERSLLANLPWRVGVPHRDVHWEDTQRACCPTASVGSITITPQGVPSG